MGLRKDGEGGEGRGPVVYPSKQRIDMAVGCSPPVDDAVVVGCGGRRADAHLACRRDVVRAVLKYSRFLWSV